MAGIIDKGTITNINGDKARVRPCNASSHISPQVVIPWHLRTQSGNLEKGTEVVYVLFDDRTGILLGRADGDWGDWLPVLTIGGNLKVGGNTTVSGNIGTDGTVTAAGNINTEGDTTAGSISLKNHTHGGVTGGTGNTNKPQ